MKATEVLRILAAVTAYQWGMVTSAQASRQGITRLDLSRLAADGHLERVAHGVYKDAGVPAGPHDDLRAAWLSTEPAMMGEERIKVASRGIVVAGESAASLHGIGDFRPRRHDFVSPARRQSQRNAIRYRQRALDPAEVTLVDGLPSMTIERTLADLVEEVGDLSLIADALRDASRKQDLNLELLRLYLAPLARRNRLKKGDGAALLDRLMEIAGIDSAAVARRVAADASLGPRVAANYFRDMSKDDLDRLVMTPAMQERVRSIQESFAAAIRSSMAPQLAESNAAIQHEKAGIVTSAGLDEIAGRIAGQVVDSDAIAKLIREWATVLSESAVLRQGMLASIRETQSEGAGD